MRGQVPDHLQTARLRLHRPRRRDAQAVFDAYASDPEVARFLTWRTHRSLADTHVFLDAADRGWSTGSELAFLAWEGERLVGATGLSRVGRDRARAGFLVARPLWGQGYATEMLQAMVDAAFAMPGTRAVEALVEPGHDASLAVLRRCGFVPDGEATGVHPNLGPELRRLERLVRRRQD
jgi:RimJ/RimL family protein N-acetyltransferase